MVLYWWYGSQFSISIIICVAYEYNFDVYVINWEIELMPSIKKKGWRKNLIYYYYYKIEKKLKRSVILQLLLYL